MFKRILVVFENELVSDEVVDHAKELAQRMDAEVTLLMLAEMAFATSSGLVAKRNAINELEERAGEAMTRIAADFLRVGVATSVALRVGDPGQELLKFMAERPPFHMVMWGSGSDLTEPERRGHWLVKAANSLECPLWTVNSRRAGKTEKH